MTVALLLLGSLLAVAAAVRLLVLLNRGALQAARGGARWRLLGSVFLLQLLAVVAFAAAFTLPAR